MADWRDSLRTVTIGGRKLIGASFRGVPFLVESSERTGGRRTVTHEFPFRPDPFVEDLDRRARTFKVDGYVLGNDYVAQRDALLAALEDEAGPGELVHPYHGVRRAICANLSVRETRNDGGMATFAIEFAETPSQAPVPVTVVDATSEVASKADAAKAAAKAELVKKYVTNAVLAARAQNPTDPVSMPAFAFASAETALTRAAAALDSAMSRVVDDTQQLATLAGQVRIITAEAASLARAPADAFDAFETAIADLADTALAAPGAVLDALIEAYGADLGAAVDATTATRQRELDNQLALTGALRRVFAIEAARLAPLAPYASLEEATAARDQVAAALEEQADGAGDTAYPALVDLRSEVLRSVPGTTAFARVVTVTRRVPIPSLVLAYQLYGSVDQEADILARNNVRHPGFVAGDLKVLTDGG